MKLIYESESRSEIRYANGKCLSAEVRTEETEQWVNKKYEIYHFIDMI